MCSITGRGKNRDTSHQILLRSRQQSWSQIVAVETEDKFKICFKGRTKSAKERGDNDRETKDNTQVSDVVKLEGGGTMA